MQSSVPQEWAFRIESWKKYVLLTLVWVVAVRIMLSLFKARAIKAKEHLNKGDEEDDLVTASFKKRFLVAFLGYDGPERVRDYWFPVFIGLSEVLSYPVLIRMNQLVVIGGWLAIKTAGQCETYTKNRTAFNRFLFANLLNIWFSYFLMQCYVTSG